MLAVFAFSITPKIILHHFVANHKDTPYASNFEKTAQIHQAGFNCSCENQVVESPFTEEFGPDQNLVKTVFPFRLILDIKEFNNPQFYYHTLGGPPAFYKS